MAIEVGGAVVVMAEGRALATMLGTVVLTSVASAPVSVLGALLASALAALAIAEDATADAAALPVVRLDAAVRRMLTRTLPDDWRQEGGQLPDYDKPRGTFFAPSGLYPCR